MFNQKAIKPNGFTSVPPTVKSKDPEAPKTINLLDATTWMTSTIANKMINDMNSLKEGTKDHGN